MAVFLDKTLQTSSTWEQVSYDEAQELANIWGGDWMGLRPYATCRREAAGARHHGSEEGCRVGLHGVPEPVSAILTTKHHVLLLDAAYGPEISFSSANRTPSCRCGSGSGRPCSIFDS